MDDSIDTLVIGYTDGDLNQVGLSVKPSVLQKALVNLRMPVVSQV
ncbi:hypothetical protein [Pseudanabaena cinerea]|jgi:hypothetical protein|nr:hypothetical protein [Pseudanabaena cinerea]